MPQLFYPIRQHKNHRRRRRHRPQPGLFLRRRHAIVSSLWRVSDVSTAMLIKNFYRQYAIHRKAESLRRAMLHVKQHYPHPGYWGAFTVAEVLYDNKSSLLIELLESEPAIATLQR